MKTLSLCVILLIGLQGYTQKYERYYDYNWQPTFNNMARFYTLVQKKDSVWERNDYFLYEKSLQMHGFYKDDSCTIAHGHFEFYHPNRHLKSSGPNYNGKKEGIWLSFYPDGTMEDSSVYSNGVLTGTSISYYQNGYLKDSSVWKADGSGVYVSWFDNGQPSSAGRYSAGARMSGVWQFFHLNGQVSSQEDYYFGKLVNKKYFDEEGRPMVDTTDRTTSAEFKGGPFGWSRYLKKQLFFPDRYKLDNADKAFVVADFIINEDGSIGDVIISTPLHPDFDIIAYKALKHSPTWQPALSHNRRVKDYLRQVVGFTQDR